MLRIILYGVLFICAGTAVFLFAESMGRQSKGHSIGGHPFVAQPATAK